jgi:hypothetical protein
MDTRSDHDEQPDKSLKDDDNRDKDKEDTSDRKSDPHFGEDPGLLETTEDPRERRLKRHTM